MRILFLAHRLPYAPDRGDRIRAYHLLRTLATSHDVEVLALTHSRAEAAMAPALSDLASRVTTVPVSNVWGAARAVTALASGRPLTHALLDAPTMAEALAAAAGRQPHLVFAYCSGMARFAFEPPLAGRPVVFDMVDVDSEKWAAFGRTAARPQRAVYAREARVLAPFEAAAAEQAFATLVVNERERAVLTGMAPRARVAVVENGVDVDTFRPAGLFSTEPRVIFTGVMNYAPNIEAARWLATEIWPRVLARRPDARLAIVGSDPPAAVRRLTRDRSIEVTGRVPDMRPWLWGSAVAVAPLKTSRGVQNKVLEAVAARLPAVVTPPVADGLPREVLPACTICASADATADAIVALLKLSPERRRAIAESADLSSLGWEQQLATVHDIIAGAASTARRRRLSREWLRLVVSA